MRLFVVVALLALARLTEALSSTTVVTRRSLAAGVAALSLPAHAETTTVVSGTVSLEKGTTAVTDEGAALYVTLKRGAAPQNVASLIAATPAPAIGALRFLVKDVTFPFKFAFARDDLFPEYADADLTGIQLTLAARLDSDGVAATRGPQDLVGAAFVAGGDTSAVLELKPRGLVSGVMKK
mmetsp:Transcript_15972/g.48309  ORF Transcript_15972/g.48309 Transcript_15972/m.48309 type:complete len:181 (+) Transcript_15972:20-562(+)